MSRVKAVYGRFRWTCTTASLFLGDAGFDQRLELDDVSSIEQPPDWLPPDKWQNILLASLLQGPLNGLCRKITENAAKWKTWYLLSCPEREALPLEVQQQHEGQLPWQYD